MTENTAKKDEKDLAKFGMENIVDMKNNEEKMKKAKKSLIEEWFEKWNKKLQKKIKEDGRGWDFLPEEMKINLLQKFFQVFDVEIKKSKGRIAELNRSSPLIMSELTEIEELIEAHIKSIKYIRSKILGDKHD